MDKKELAAIDKTITNLQRDLNQLIERKISIFQKEHYPALKEKYEGKFFESLNGFGGDSKKWKVFTKVLPFTEDDVYMTANNEPTAHIKVVEFELMPDSFGKGSFTAVMKGSHQTYIHCLDKEITEKQFMKGYDKFVAAVASIL